jgi:hypothetical protein
MRELQVHKISNLLRKYLMLFLKNLKTIEFWIFEKLIFLKFNLYNFTKILLFKLFLHGHAKQWKQDENNLTTGCR